MLGRIERGADAAFAERTEEADGDPQQRSHALNLSLDEREGVVPTSASARNAGMPAGTTRTRPMPSATQ